MVDLQRKPRGGNGGGVVIVAGLAVVALGVGGYFGWRAWQDHQTRSAAAGAGMDITRTQARARVNGVEPGTNLSDWTRSPTGAGGFSCDTMIIGRAANIRVWNVCGTGETLVRVTVGPKGEAVTPVSDEAADMLDRLARAAAPEAPETRRRELIDALPNAYASGGKAKAEIGAARISFSTDKDGEITRFIANPAD